MIIILLCKHTGKLNLRPVHKHNQHSDSEERGVRHVHAAESREQQVRVDRWYWRVPRAGSRQYSQLPPNAREFNLFFHDIVYLNTSLI